MTSLNGNMISLNGPQESETPPIIQYINEENSMNWLANIVSVFHGLVVLFVIITPFFDIPYFLILHFTFCVSLLVHWYGNSNVCSLSMLESKLRGLDYTESFTHKFVAPIYDVSKTTWSRICYIVTIILMSISAYKIYQSPKWKEAVQCYHNVTEAIQSDPKIKELPIYKKMMLYYQCVKIVFT